MSDGEEIEREMNKKSVKRNVRRFRYIVLALTISVEVGCASSCYFLIPIEKELQKILNIDSLDYSLFFSICGFLNIVFSIVVGALTISWGRNKVFLCLALISLIGQIIASLGIHKNIMSYTLVLIGQTLTNTAIPNIENVGASYTSVWFKNKETSFAMSVDLVSNALVGFLVFSAQPYIFNMTQELTANFWMVSILNIFAFVACLLLIYVDQKAPDRVKRQEDEANNFRFTFKVFGKMGLPFWLITINRMTFLGAFDIFNYVVCKYFQDRFGLDNETSGLIVGSTFAIMAIPSLLIGYLLSKYGHKVHVSMIGILIMIAGFDAFILLSDCGKCYKAVPVYFIMSFGFFCCEASFWPSVPYVVSSNLVGLGYGINLAGDSLVDGVFSPLVGYLVENTKEYHKGFMGLEIMCIVLSVIAFVPLYFLNKWDKAHGNKLRISEEEASTFVARSHLAH